MHLVDEWLVLPAGRLNHAYADPADEAYLRRTPVELAAPGEISASRGRSG